MTCIGNSGPLPETVVEAIEKVNKTDVSWEMGLFWFMGMLYNS
jgi:hypothetical protein